MENSYPLVVTFDCGVKNPKDVPVLGCTTGSACARIASVHPTTCSSNTHDHAMAIYHQIVMPAFTLPLCTEMSLIQLSGLPP